MVKIISRLNQVLNISDSNHIYNVDFNINQNNGQIQRSNITATGNIPYSTHLTDSQFIIQSPSKLQSTDNILKKPTIKRQLTPPMCCRICLDTQSTLSNKLINPCNCMGSVAYIHEECLKTWLVSNKKFQNPQCELCKYEYQMEFVIQKVCLPLKMCKKKKKNMSALLCLIIVFIFMLALQIIVILQMQNNKKKNKNLSQIVKLYIQMKTQMITKRNQHPQEEIVLVLVLSILQLV